jgi:hypothetical protein
MTATKLDAFTRSYIETALWSSTDEDGLALDNSYDPEDIAPATLAEMVEDCEAFQRDHADDIGDRAEQAGHDFWLTRNRHGAGFWDGDWPHPAGDRLAGAAHVHGSIDLYVGDDGMIHA